MWRVLSWYKSIKGRNVMASWNEVFGDRYQAGHSNIYRFKKWMDTVGVPRLEFALLRDPMMTVKRCQKGFSDQWNFIRQGSVEKGKGKRACEDDDETFGSCSSKRVKRSMSACSSSSSSDVQVVSGGR